MGTLVLTNAMVTLSSGTSSTAPITDISSQLTKVALTRKFDDHDDTRMGMTAHSHVPGLEQWSAQLEAIQEFGSTAAVPLDKLLSGYVGPTPFWVAIRPVNAARSSDNPEYAGQVRLFGYEPINGEVGQPLKTTIPLVGAGNLARYSSSS